MADQAPGYYPMQSWVDEGESSGSGQGRAHIDEYDTISDRGPDGAVGFSTLPVPTWHVPHIITLASQVIYHL